MPRSDGGCQSGPSCVGLRWRAGPQWSCLRSVASPKATLTDGVDTGVHVIDGLGQALPDGAVRHGQRPVEP